MVLTLLIKYLAQYWRGLLVVVLFSILSGWLVHHFEPVQTQTVTIHDTKEVTVEKPVVTTKVVTQVIKDPTDQRLAKAALAENTALKAKVTELTSTNAVVQFVGTGIPQAKVEGNKTTDQVYAFKDFQLDATYTVSKFTYTLNQQFKVVTTTSRLEDGRTVGFVTLYQIRPEGPVKLDAQTTSINVDEAISHWMVSPRIQGGLEVEKGAQNGVIALQWLKHGKSKDPKDLRWAILSPAVILGQKTREAGMLPFSINLGNIPKQPLSNIWLSPIITQNKTFGLTISATF